MITKSTIKALTFAAFATFFAGTADAAEKLEICVSPKGGPMHFISSYEPLSKWDYCIARGTVVREAFNTTALTWNPSVAFDYNQRKFTRAAALHRLESTLPGEHLYITDIMVDGRTVVYSLASRRFFLANLRDPGSQLTTMQDYLLNQKKSGGNPVYYTTDSDVYLNSGLTKKGSLSRGRLVVGLGNTQPKGGKLYEEIRCLNKGCGFKRGWVAQTDLSEIRAITRDYSVIPEVIERPIDFPIKQCGPSESQSQVAEIEASINAELNLPLGAGIKLSSSIKAKLQQARTRQYAENVEVFWTVFTSVEFSKHEPFFGQHRWIAKKAEFVAIQETTLLCGTDDQKSRYLVVTDEVYAPLGEFEGDLSVKNTNELNDFLGQLRSRLSNHVEDWLLRHIAVSISGRR